MLATRCDYPLHVGLTEAGLGSKGIVATTAALSVLLQQGIGDTIRASLTPLPNGDRTDEVIVSQQVLQALDAATLQRSGDIQAILPQLQTVVANLQPITDVYEKDQPQVDDIFVQLNTIMQTLADEHTQLGGLLGNGNAGLGARLDGRDALSPRGARPVPIPAAPPVMAEGWERHPVAVAVRAEARAVFEAFLGRKGGAMKSSGTLLIAVPVAAVEAWLFWHLVLLK